MPKDYGPPSKPEREQLVQARKQDTSRLAPAPKPPGFAGTIVDTALAKKRVEAASHREQRIHTIDKALHARKDQAKAALSKANTAATQRVEPSKVKSKTGKERTR